jgi:hypothetical protein
VSSWRLHAHAFESTLTVDIKDHIAELGINPLFVFAKGKGVKAGDALIKPVVRD